MYLNLTHYLLGENIFASLLVSSLEYMKYVAEGEFVENYNGRCIVHIRV